MPALFNAAENVNVLITEAGIDGLYPVGHLARDSESTPDSSKDLYHLWWQDLWGTSANQYQPSAEFDGSGTWRGPWRVVMQGSYEAIVESNIVQGVAPAQATDPSGHSWDWVTPGLAATSAFAGVNQMNLAANRAAEELGQQWVLYDYGWDQDPCIRGNAGACTGGGGVTNPVVDAHNRGLKVMVWTDYACVDNQVSLPNERADFFDDIESLGIDGLKIDFIERSLTGAGLNCSSQSHYDRSHDFNRYVDLARDAAERQLAVVFHSATMPRGLEVTYPNVLGYEGVKGAEYNYELGAVTTTEASDVTLGFTRNVVGPMDYMADPTFMGRCRPLNTSQSFYDTQLAWCSGSSGNRTVSSGASVWGSRGHQMAMLVAYQTGFNVLWGGQAADIVGDFGWPPASGDVDRSTQPMPDLADMIEGLPATWQRTEFIHGAPYASFAVARLGDNGEWWVAFLTTDTRSDPLDRVTTIPLSFLGAGDYTATLWNDGEDTAGSPSEHLSQVVLKTSGVPTRYDSGDSVNVSYDIKGGFVMRFTPED
jgi:hypothetical protein